MNYSIMLFYEVVQCVFQMSSNKCKNFCLKILINKLSLKFCNGQYKIIFIPNIYTVFLEY